LLLAIAKVVAVIAVAFLAWLLLAGAVMDLLLRHADVGRRRDESQYPWPDSRDDRNNLD
jgi:hypothetical protein